MDFGYFTFGEFMSKSKTVREGDYLWMGGKKVLWRTLDKSTRQRAIHEMKEERENETSFIKKKKKSW